jgi:hypothetical protein
LRGNRRASPSLVSGGDFVVGDAPPGSAEALAFQERTPLFATPHGHALLGLWVVGDEAVGVREDDTPITGNTSRFAPHCSGQAERARMRENGGSSTPMPP